ncbi:Rap1a/Tai family immunity protein [Paraglaciecola aquimarina]|uniref:Rap1a/Tai family immunity protein n=1 Tax=Paraglaciecola aquimarina TaxID=1235557 RepID=A0ABU3SSR8_9ALTE|nr:Rap1a/Tai family immunity protein [Paraglaciecola aquimarina]MDU0353017.1 Rap1a/Tai family immunity protein [Paraglaciecola aquimarina]
MSLTNTHSSMRNTVKIYSKLAVAVLTLQLALVPTANSFEVLSAQELASHCAILKSDPRGADGQFCVRYIQGFIDGAIATDARVMLNAENNAPGNESYAERAMRTRMLGRIELSRAAKLAGFCLGDPLPLKNVVKVVAADIATSLSTEEKSKPAMDAVYKSLIKNYPCK